MGSDPDQDLNESTQGAHPFVKVGSLRFTYASSTPSRTDTPFVLHCDELCVERGESVAIVGPSGSGKTTLLSLIAGLILPDTGFVHVDGERIDRLDDAARRAYRVQKIGFVFQDFQLLDYLSVRENIALPFRIHPSMRWSEQSQSDLLQVSRALGIEPLLSRRVQRLSQGERQRVAIGRALVTKPRLILGDEPTGNLDVANRDRVLDLILEQAALLSATVIMVTHDQGLLDRFDRVIDIRDATRLAQSVDGETASEERRR